MVCRHDSDGDSARVGLPEDAKQQRDSADKTNKKCSDTLVLIHVVVLVRQRLAVQRSGRRQAGAAILRRCPCGVPVSQSSAC